MNATLFVLALANPGFEEIVEQEVAALQSEKVSLQVMLEKLQTQARREKKEALATLDALSAQWVKLKTENTTLQGDGALRESVLRARRSAQDVQAVLKAAQARGLEAEGTDLEQIVEVSRRALAGLLKTRGVRLDPKAEYFNQAGEPDTGPVVWISEVAALAVGAQTAGAMVPTQQSQKWEIVEPKAGPGARAYFEGKAKIASLVLVEPDAALPYLRSKTGWRQWFTSGGPVMWPILLLAMVAALFCTWRCAALFRLRAKRSDAFVESIGHAIRTQDFDAANLAAGKRNDLCGDVALEIVEHREQTRSEQEDRAAAVMLAWRAQLERGLALIAVVAAVTPLLGLLGTVSGMIETFWMLGSRAGQNATALSGGISKALLTTQFGLAVAIPTLLVHAALQRWVERTLEAGERVALATMNAIDKQMKRVRPISVTHAEDSKAAEGA